MVTASVMLLSGTRGINNPLSVAEISNIDELLGVAPVVFMPTFCGNVAVVQQHAIKMTSK